jgi:hypothetical protein
MFTESENSLTYNIIYTTYRANTSMIIPRLCNSIIAINQGVTVATVNGVILNPGTAGVNNGESFVFGGNKGEIFYGRVDISFPTGAGNVLVVQKIYLFSEQLNNIKF